MDKKRKRDIKLEALKRLEEAARTQAEFENVLTVWEKLEENDARNDRRKYIPQSEAQMNWETSGDTIFPAPLRHEYWRQLLRGDFLDVIFDCPYELHEMTSSHGVSESVKALNDNQKEVLYFKAIRLYSVKKIAKIRGQTDRNVLKVYTTLINTLRRKLYERLFPRWEAKEPLTLSQREFVEWYFESIICKKKSNIDGGKEK